MNTNDDRLWCLPGSDFMHTDVDALVADLPEPGEYTIEEWTTHPTRYHLPSADRLLDFVAEELNEIDEGFADQVADVAVYSAAVKEAAEACLNAIAERVTYLMAKERVGTHRIVVDEDGFYADAETGAEL